MTNKPIININELEMMDFGQGEKFSARLGEVAIPIGLTRIGCMLTEVLPGKTAFPFHNHHNIDEMFVILEGEGEYRFGEETHKIKQGDVLAAPAGGPEVAHQILNTGDKPIRYLGISDVTDPYVVEYPDSDKFLVTSRMNKSDPRTAKLRYIGRLENSLDYFDGEM